MYWQLFSTFFKIGAFTIGGGYAMIPLIQEEVVSKRKWIEEQEFLDLLAMAQSAPGVIAINTAVFIGYRLKGFRGSVICALGSALPSFLMILGIALFFTQIKDSTIVEHVFKGIRPAVVALIVAPLYKMAQAARINWRNAWVPIVAALVIWKLGISPIWIVVLAMIGGLVFYRARDKK